MIGKLLLFRRPKEPAEFSDEALLAACAVQDMAALGKLFERFADPVYGFLSRLLNSHGEELDDLVQATFLEVQRGAKNFSGKSSARTWILGIAANLARNHIRGEVRKRAALSLLSSQDTQGPARPDQTAERRQMVEKLAIALESLPHDLRVAFVMCDLEQLPGAEAAAALNVREGTLSRRLFEARKALRAALEANT